MGTSARYLFQPDTDDDEYATSLTSASLLGEKEGGPVSSSVSTAGWFGPILALLFLPLRLLSVTAAPTSEN
jgi:hypothetical protein